MALLVVGPPNRSSRSAPAITDSSLTRYSSHTLAIANI
jgi:hypothetical protein